MRVKDGKLQKEWEAWMAQAEAAQQREIQDGKQSMGQDIQRPEEFGSTAFP